MCAASAGGTDGPPLRAPDAHHILHVRLVIEVHVHSRVRVIPASDVKFDPGCLCRCRRQAAPRNRCMWSKSPRHRPEADV